MAEDAVRAMQQQFTTALDSLNRHNVHLQAELVQNRQQAANWLAALREELRAPLRATSTTGVGVDTSFLGKAKRHLRGARRVARLEHSVQGVRWHAGATMPRLQKLMDDAAKATETTPNATILDDDNWAALAQPCWMMLTICKGAALNTLFLAGDSEGLESWRQLTEKIEPKMRTRFSGQLMSILSFSLKGETEKRITAWERERAYERYSGKILG